MKPVKPTTFDEAIKLLDEALERQSIPQLSSLVQSEYSQFKISFLNEPAIREFTTTANDFADVVTQVSGHALAQVSTLAVAGIAHSRDLSRAIDREVRANPLPFIAGAAVGALALGYLLARQTESVELARPPQLTGRDATREAAQQAARRRTDYYVASRGART